MVKVKQRVFLVLVVASAILFLASFLLPWWSADLTVQGFSAQVDAIQIYGYGLHHDMGQLRVYILEDETPLYQTILAFVYLGISLGLVAWGSRLKNKNAMWLLVFCGLVYIGYLGATAYVIDNRMGQFDISLTGWSTYRSAARSVSFFTEFLPGYYLGYAACAGLLASGLMSKFIYKKMN